MRDYAYSEIEGSFFPPIPVEMVGGVSVATLDRRETARFMIKAVLCRRKVDLAPMIFSSTNGQVLSEVSRASGWRVAKLLELVDMNSADGQPLVFASRLFGRGTVTERCATTDLFHDVARLACDENVTFYILGATPQENDKAVRNVRRLYPRLRIVGSHHGYFNGPEDEERIVQEIDRLAPDIVWVSLGFPRELEFCFRWRDAMPHVGALKTSGGLMNFLSGTRSRAPRWMQVAGLEWSYRLALEPRRLLLRYFTTNLHAAWLLIRRTNSNVSH